MSGPLSRSLLLTAALGLLGACDLLDPPQAAAPAAAAPVAAAPVKKAAAAPAAKPAAAAPAPVKKKAPVVIDFDEGGSGGGGWG